MWTSAAVAHELRSRGSRAQLPCARGISPDKELNPCLLHWQADYRLLRHQGDNKVLFLDLDVVTQIHAFCKAV